jgi:hypothetical protein
MRLPGDARHRPYPRVYNFGNIVLAHRSSSKSSTLFQQELRRHMVKGLQQHNAGGEKAQQYPGV